MNLIKCIVPLMLPLYTIAGGGCQSKMAVANQQEEEKKETKPNRLVRSSRDPVEYIQQMPLDRENSKEMSRVAKAYTLDKRKSLDKCRNSPGSSPSTTTVKVIRLRHHSSSQPGLTPVIDS